MLVGYTNIACVNLITCLLVRSLYFKKPYNLKTLLTFVTIKKCYQNYGRVPPIFTWHISRIIMHSISPIVSACVLNQFNEHWLFFDMLHSIIFMCFKFKE